MSRVYPELGQRVGLAAPASAPSPELTVPGTPGALALARLVDAPD